jgi:nucleoid DNA-binding protein
LTLRKVERKARKGRNPKNPEEEYEIPARLDIKCVLGKSLAEKLNK